MTSSLREYGLIALLIAVSVGGYLLFERNKEDLLSFSLDAIGTKLVNLVDDETAKIRIAEAFKRFQQQVRDNELRPRSNRICGGQCPQFDQIKCPDIP